MADPKPTCSTCGSPLPGAALDGLCPACLLTFGSAADAGGFEPPAPEELDAALPDYDVTAFVGRGGMGAVYRARQHSLGRDVALKLVAGVPDPGFADRFAREAHVTAGLDHPAVVPVHESGFDALGRAFYTMRLVHGHQLTHAFRLAAGNRDGWNLPRAVAAVVKVAQAVAYAHGKGVVHRDLKPANIMVGDLGEVYVMDWGLAAVNGEAELYDLRPSAPAKTAGTSPLLTLDGTVVGTPAYMAPEQARGDTASVDHLSDVYALGAILYELLATHPPHMPPGSVTTPAEVLDAVTRDAPDPVREIRPDVPPELAAVCEKAMARDRAGRYTSAADLAEDLQAFLDGRVVRAHRTGALTEAVKWVKRNRLAATGLAAAAAGVAAAAVFQTLSQQQTSAARDDALDHLASSFAATGVRHATDGEHALASLWFAKAATTARDPEVAALHHTRAHTHGRHTYPVVRAFQAGTPDAWWVKFHPSGRYLSLIGDNVEVWDIDAERQLDFGDPRNPYQTAWSPDGSLLAISRVTGTISVLRFPSLEPVFDMSANGAVVIALAFSPDGTQLAFGGNYGLEVWSVDGRSKRHELGSDPNTNWSTHQLTFSPDGARLLVTDDQSKVHVLDLGVGTAQPVEAFTDPVPHQLYLGASMANRPRFTPDGRHFLVRRPRRELAWHDPATGQPTSTSTAITSRFSFSPQGDRLVAGEGSTVHVRDAATGDSLAAVTYGDEVIQAAFAPDGASFFTATKDGVVDWRRTADASLVGVLTDQPIPISNVALSPTGHHAAVSYFGGLIRIFDLRQPAGDDVAVLETTPVYADTAVALHPGRTRFAVTGTPFVSTAITAVRVHDVATLEPRSPPLPVGGPALGATFLGAGETLLTLGSTATDGAGRNPDASGTPAAPGTLQLWDWRAGILTNPPIPTPSEPHTAVPDPLAPDSFYLLCAAGEVFRYDAGSHDLEPLFTAGPSGIGSYHTAAKLAVTPDGETLVAATDKQHVFVFDLPARQLRFPPLDLGAPCSRIELHPSRQVLATVTFATHGADEHARFWDLDDGTPAAPDIVESDWLFLGHFAPGGETFLTGGRNRTAKLHPFPPGDVPLHSIALPAPPTSAAFSPSAPFFVLTCRDPLHLVAAHDTRTGLPLAPPLATPSAPFPTATRFGADDRFALVSGTGLPGVLRWDLSPVLDAPPLPGATTLEHTTLQAGTDALDNGNATDITHRQWLARWQAFRTTHPDTLPFDP